jgi:hypothetical protein
MASISIFPRPLSDDIVLSLSTGDKFGILAYGLQAMTDLTVEVAVQRITMKLSTNFEHHCKVTHQHPSELEFCSSEIEEDKEHFY